MTGSLRAMPTLATALLVVRRRLARRRTRSWSRTTTTSGACPCHDDVELFERLALESFQAGLSWSTILRKRDGVPAAPSRASTRRVVAAFGPDDGTD